MELDIITNSMDMNLSKLREIVTDRGCSPQGHKESDGTLWLNNKNNGVRDDVWNEDTDMGVMHLLIISEAVR